MEHTIYCTAPGDNPSFPVNILLTKTVGELKDAIKAKIPDQVGCSANLLKLYRKHQGSEVELVIPYLKLSDNRIFGQDGPLEASVLQHEHIAVRLPDSESVDSALGRFPDNALHMVVVPPAGELIMTTVCGTLTETVLTPRSSRHRCFCVNVPAILICIRWRNET